MRRRYLLIALVPAALLAINATGRWWRAPFSQAEMVDFVNRHGLADYDIVDFRQHQGPVGQWSILTVTRTGQHYSVWFDRPLYLWPGAVIKSQVPPPSHGNQPPDG